MRNLNQVELSAIAGCGPTLSLTSNERNGRLGFGVIGAMLGFCALGVQRVAIDALKPYCSSIVDVNTFSVFLGSNFGSAEHISHAITSTIALAGTLGMAGTAAHLLTSE